MSEKSDTLACFGDPTMSDTCAQCSLNDACVEKMMKEKETPM